MFFKEHDNGLYKELEKRNSIHESKQHCLLVAFRSACAVRHQEEQRLHIYETTGVGSELDREKECVVLAFNRRMDALVLNLWDTINGNSDNHYLFRMIAMPRINIAASDRIINEEDLESHLMDYDYNAPLNSLSINLIPDRDRLLFLLDCGTKSDKGGKYRSIIISFPIGDVLVDYYLDTVKGILLNCSNWSCAPMLYNESERKGFFDDYEGMNVKFSLYA